MKFNFFFTITALVLCLSTSIKAQSFDPFIQQHVDQLSYDSLYLRLQQFEDLGIKSIANPNLNATGDWIINFYQQNGYTNIELDSFQVMQHMVYNIIVTKTGTIYPETYLIVDGHYDTYAGPGVNDNGSGTAIVMETARIMKDVETEYSIKFIHFTVEEMGLLGSYHYVENTVIPENLDIRLVFNIDEVGGVAGEVNNTITCERDEWAPNGNNAASAAFTDTLATLTEMYSNLNTWIYYAYGTDYIPFMENGYVITGFYEYNESPWPHSINDSLSRLDPEYVFEVTKASLAASMYFSGAVNINVGFSSISELKHEVKVYPNPFSDFIKVDNFSTDKWTIDLYNSQGVLKQSNVLFQLSTLQIDLSHKDRMYFYRISNENGEAIDSGKLIRQ